MRIVKSCSDDWCCFWPWPSLYCTKTKNGMETPETDTQYAILLAWLWWILVIHEWNPTDGKS